MVVINSVALYVLSPTGNAMPNVLTFKPCSCHIATFGKPMRCHTNSDVYLDAREQGCIDCHNRLRFVRVHSNFLHPFHMS